MKVLKLLVDRNSWRMPKWISWKEKLFIAKRCRRRVLNHQMFIYCLVVLIQNLRKCHVWLKENDTVSCWLKWALSHPDLFDKIQSLLTNFTWVKILRNWPFSSIDWASWLPKSDSHVLGFVHEILFIFQKFLSCYASSWYIYFVQIWRSTFIQSVFLSSLRIWLPTNM